MGTGVALLVAVASDVITVLGEAAPLGVAGLVASMWLLERRGAAERDRQLTSAHERVMEQRTQLETLVEIVRDNTRAVAALEDSQRQLHGALRDVSQLLRSSGGVSGEEQARRRSA
jgi:hypothetical protein